jgi:hypothetical protein
VVGLYWRRAADFIVPFNEDREAIGKNIIKNIFLNRLGAGKPTVVVVVGDSGEGKSYAVLRILEVLCEIWKFNLFDYLNDCIIFTLFEYKPKMDKLFNDKELKRFKAVVFDEAGEVVPAKQWSDFAPKAIAKINKMSRQRKKMIIFVVVQYFSDITPDIRRTATFYCYARRPLRMKTNFTISRKWIDDRDLDRLKLRKKGIKGYIVKDGTYIPHKPTFEMNLPDKELCKKYDAIATAQKIKIIDAQLEQIFEKLEGLRLTKKSVKVMEYFNENPQLLEPLFERRRGKKRLKKNIGLMYNLSKEETEEFEKMATKKLIEMGVFE